MHHVETEQIVEAPPETVWAKYTDHVGWSRWAGLGNVTLEREGSPTKNGVGAIRVFNNGIKVREEVLSFEAPSRMTYRLVSGAFPLTNHLGTVLFEPHPQGTRVVWRCQFDSRLPFVGGLIEKSLQRLFSKTLSRLVRKGMSAETGASGTAGTTSATA